MPDWIEPDWPAPANVHAVTTTRHGGASQPPFDSFNLATHVGDDIQRVLANRRLLSDLLDLPAEPAWLDQVHGCDAVEAGRVREECRADAVFSRQPGQVCAVLTADCLPILLCNRAGTEVAAVHAGWRGLAGGVIESVLAGLRSGPAEIIAWLGPAIGPRAFEVGEEVRQAFLEQPCHQPQAEQAFKPGRAGRWQADLYQLARQRLAAQGVTGIYGGSRCTFTESGMFYSYRRDGVTGRMASLIWIGG